MKKNLFALLFGLIVSFGSFGQTVATTKIGGLNAMTYLPAKFDKTKAYPCLLFLPGAGEIGTNAALLQNHGPFQYLKPGVDLGLDIIVISIQNVNANPRPSEVQGYINAVKALYNIGPLVGTGLSRGGQDWEWYACNAESQMAQLAGLVLFSSEGTVSDAPGIPGTWNPGWIQKYKVKYWLGIGTQDPFYSANQSKYKSVVALDPTLATWTEWPGVGHSDPVWSDGYNPAWTNNGLKMSIYKWTASLGAPAPPPVIIPPIKAKINIDSTVINIPNSIVRVNADSSSGGITGYQWLQVSGPSTAIFTPASGKKMIISGLFPGKYSFRLFVSDSTRIDSADVSVVVNPLPTCPVCPVCPPPIVCPVCPAPRTVTGINWVLISGKWTLQITYSDGAAQSIAD